MNSTEFEKKIEYKFKERRYLEMALTHSSYSRDKSSKHKDNERLEFLGDAFLDAIVSAKLYEIMLGDSEGKLTKTRSLIVCEKALAEVARNINLGKYMNMGHGEESAGGRTKESILADGVEAVIGAIFLDGGYEQADNFVMRFFAEIIDEAVKGKIFSDYKSEVQEMFQSKGKPVTISYVIDREEGPAHDKTFFIHMECNNVSYGSGVGKNKKEAEQNAARETMMILKRGEKQ